MNGRTNEGTKGRRNERRNELKKGLTGLNGWKGRRTNELTYRRMNEWMNIIVLLFIQNNYCLKQGKNELLANRTSKNADVLRWLIEAVFTRIFWLFVLFFSVTLVIWTLLLKFFFAAEKKNCQGSVWRGVPFTAKHNNTLHDIDIATRDQRMKNSGAFHGLDHPSYPVKYNSMRNYFNSCLAGERPNWGLGKSPLTKAGNARGYRSSMCVKQRDVEYHRSILFDSESTFQPFIILMSNLSPK